jgi:hypothetical protein
MSTSTKRSLSAISDDDVMEGLCCALTLRGIAAIEVTRPDFAGRFAFDEAMVVVGELVEEVCKKRGLVSTSSFILGPISGQCAAAQDALLRMYNIGLGYVKPPFYNHFFLSLDEVRAQHRLERLAQHTGLEPDIFRALAAIFVIKFHQ